MKIVPIHKTQVCHWGIKYRTRFNNSNEIHQTQLAHKGNTGGLVDFKSNIELQNRQYKFYYNIYTMFFLLALIVLTFNCGRLPQSVGRSRDVVVISSVIDTTLILDNLQMFNYLPQKEELFNFFFTSDTAIMRCNKFHALFLYGSLQDEFIDLLLDSDAKKATKIDTFTLFKLNDMWAKGQLTIILATSESKYLHEGVTRYSSIISKTLEDNYYERVKENYYKKGIDEKASKTLAKYGIGLDLTEGWLIDSTHRDKNFIFVHTHFPDRSIFVYEDQIDKDVNVSYAIDKRNELTGMYYNGDYVLRDLTYGEEIEFKNMTGIRLKGVWQNDSLVAGGPFISYFLAKNDTVLVIDGMLFNPGERKSDYLTAMEVIMNSLKVTILEKTQ